jgi:hypothetical protein
MNTLVTIKQTLFTNWHFVRWFRLGIGLFIAVQAVQLHDSLSGFVAALFLFQAATNTGCCGASGCGVPPAQGNDDVEDVKFEEITAGKNKGEK